jgi:hypothetical protein
VRRFDAAIQRNPYSGFGSPRMGNIQTVVGGLNTPTGCCIAVVASTPGLLWGHEQASGMPGRDGASAYVTRRSAANWPLGVVVLVIILVGVAGLAYLVMCTSGAMPLPRRPDERDTRDVERHTPH